MTPLVDLEPLMPSDEVRAARRDALVAELQPSPSLRRRARAPRGLRRLALVTAVVAGIAAAVVVVPRSGGPDIVASARAAASVPRDRIVHLLVRYEHGPYVSMGSYTDGDHPQGPVIGKVTGDEERWSASNPSRQRSVQFLETPTGGQATIQTAFAPGVVKYRESWDGTTITQRLTPEQQREQDAQRRKHGGTLEAATFSDDPVAALRALLGRGVLQEDGHTELDGRRVARLVGREAGYTDSGGTWSPPVDYEYLVDAETFAPVRITTVQVLPARPGDPEPAARKERRIVDRWIFETYELLPRNAETERLLDIDPRG